MILAPLSVLAQNTVTGRVINSNAGEALVGVTVGVNGTSRVAITDAGGAFRIEASPSDVLTFALVGYTNQTVAVGGRTRIDVQLDEAAVDIDEVVVVGYGVMRKSDLTSSITKIGGEDVQQMNSGNVATALQGMAPGVLVVSGSGAPGTEPSVMIRGITSINLNSQPLYVIDGMPGGRIGDLNPADIESIEVLKDASASAIYGSQASNGVIMVTTKKGLAGKPVFSAEIVYGFQLMKAPYEMANVQEYVQALNAAYKNSGLDEVPFTNPSEYADRKSTPWWDTGIANAAPQMNANVSVRGGSDTNRYSASLSYYQQDSFYKLVPDNGRWQRFTARLTNDWNFAKWISAGIMLNPRFTSSGSPGNWGDYLSLDPVTPIYKPELDGTENEFSVYARSNLSYIPNPVAANKRFFDKSRNYGLSGNTYVDIKPVSGLVLKSFLGFDYRLNTRDRFQPDYVIDLAHEKQEVNNVARWHNYYNSYSWQNTATWMKTFNDKHNLTLMAGMTMDRAESRTLDGSRDAIPNNMDALREINAGTTNQLVNGTSGVENALLSYFGRVNYNYDNRYLLTATVRRDGSSKFMARNKWATFPSASFAWNMANEKFMESTRGVVDNLKLRVGWGQVGNQNLPSSVYLSNLSGVSTSNVYVDGENVVNMIYISSLKNEDIKWETVEDISMGVDFSLFRDKLSGSVDYYIKNTRDMIFQKPYPQYSGFPSDAQIWTNVGSMRSKGWDINLAHRNKIGDFSYSVAVNLTTFDVEVTRMASETPIYGAEITNSSIVRSITQTGGEPGAFFGLVMDGIFQNQAEVDAHVNSKGERLQPAAKPGDIRFKNVNGDDAINNDDRTILGSPWADLTAGLNINLAYKGFDLMAHFYGSFGNELANWDVTRGLYMSTGSNYIAGINEIAWHGEGTSNRIPILSRSDANKNYDTFSSLFVEDGTYFRLKNLQVGYTLPKRVTDKIGFSRMRVYVTGLNLLTFTKFTGTDPEISGGNNNDGFRYRPYGFAGWTYPQLRTFLFGVNLNF